MIEKKNETLGVSFTLPDKLTVRQQLAYFSEAGLARGKDTFERYWRGARSIVQDWQCEKVPDLNFDLEKVTDPKVTPILIWSAMEVKNYFDALDDVPKN